MAEHSKTRSWRARYADRFVPLEKQLAGLSADVLRLVDEAVSADRMPVPPDDDEDMFEWQANMRARMRCNVHALNSLSDVELDVAFGVAIGAEQRRLEDELFKAVDRYAALHQGMRGIEGFDAVHNALYRVSELFDYIEQEADSVPAVDLPDVLLKDITLLLISHAEWMRRRSGPLPPPQAEADTEEDKPRTIPI